jgi:hypothetical protein
MTNLIVPAGAPERWAPNLTGLLAQSCDTGNCAGSLQPTTQDAIGVLIPIPQAIVVSTIWVRVQTAGIGLTALQNLMSLHNALGTILSTTADQSAVWLSGGTFSAALPGGPFTLPPPYCWAQVLAGGGTTPVFSAGAAAGPADFGPTPAGLRSQRVALGAISLASFNPVTSNTSRNLILVGLS